MPIHAKCLLTIHMKFTRWPSYGEYHRYKTMWASFQVNGFFIKYFFLSSLFFQFSGWFRIPFVWISLMRDTFYAIGFSISSFLFACIFIRLKCVWIKSNSRLENVIHRQNLRKYFPILRWVVYGAQCTVGFAFNIS